MSTPPHLTLPPSARAITIDTPRGAVATHVAVPSGTPREDGSFSGSSVAGRAVLVPGFTGSKEDFITVLEPLSSAGYHVVAMDQRGQFETPGPDSEDAYTLEALGADVLAVASVLGDGHPVHLVGHSFGGLVVRAATIADPGAVASTTLLCSGPGPISVPREVERLEMLLGALSMMSVADIWTYVQAAAATNGEYNGVDPAVVQFMADRFLGTDKASLIGMGNHLLHVPDRSGELNATGVPLMVAHGVEDYIWLPAEQAGMAAALGCRYEVIADAAHSPAVQQPGATARLLTDFWSVQP